MKKVFLAIAIMGIILCGCGQAQEENVKTESSETQKKEGVRIQSCEFPVDINAELYIDSVYLQEKLQVLSLTKENNDFVLKRNVMSEVGGNTLKDPTTKQHLLAKFIKNPKTHYLLYGNSVNS